VIYQGTKSLFYSPKSNGVEKQSLDASSSSYDMQPPPRMLSLHTSEKSRVKEEDYGSVLVPKGGGGGGRDRDRGLTMTQLVSQ
jgi:hypothetical protein